MVYKPNVDPMKFFPVIINCKWFLSYGWDLVPTFPLCWYLSCLNLCRSCDSCVHMCICVSELTCIEDSVCQNLSTTFGFCHIPPSSTWIPWILREEAWKRHPMSVPVSYSLLAVLFWISMLTIIYCKKKPLWWGFCDMLINEIIISHWKSFYC